MGVGVLVGVMGVSVRLGVHDGMGEGVRDAVSVNEGVNVGGWNRVGVMVLVGVMVGVRVEVGVLVAVPVTIGGVGVRVGETGVLVRVKVAVTDGVKSDGLGASAMAIQPMQ